MAERQETNTTRAPSGERQTGSALVIAVFVLVLVTSLGVALLFLSTNEVQLSQADLRSKTVYYLSEAGLEDSRASVWAANLISTNPLSLDDELATRRDTTPISSSSWPT
jgi:Tfp pilus assembly protein PilX